MYISMGVEPSEVRIHPPCFDVVHIYFLTLSSQNDWQRYIEEVHTFMQAEEQSGEAGEAQDASIAQPASSQRVTRPAAPQPTKQVRINASSSKALSSHTSHNLAPVMLNSQGGKQMKGCFLVIP